MPSQNDWVHPYFSEDQHSHDLCFLISDPEDDIEENPSVATIRATSPEERRRINAKEFPQVRVGEHYDMKRDGAQRNDSRVTYSDNDGFVLVYGKERVLIVGSMELRRRS
jgi:hypothetical protein